MKTILSALGCENAALSVYITDDNEIRELNRQWLGRDRETDVMAWSQNEGVPFPTDFLGDVVISADTAIRQAGQRGHSPDHELNVLIAHGVLHLLGYEHVNGGRQARKMFETQKRLVELIEEQEKKA
ncbi:MAG: rRNA maturation RNase YbeY [bacterium]